MTTAVFVYTMNGRKGKWPRYLLPFSVEAFAQLGDDLYIRHGDTDSNELFADVPDLITIGPAP